MHTFRHPFPSWTHSRRAVDRGLLFSPSPSAASSEASGSPLSCDVPPPDTAPFSLNLKSQSSQWNHVLCNHVQILKMAVQLLCYRQRTTKQEFSLSHIQMKSGLKVPMFTNNLHLSKSWKMALGLSVFSFLLTCFLKCFMWKKWWRCSYVWT